MLHCIVDLVKYRLTLRVVEEAAVAVNQLDAIRRWTERNIHAMIWSEVELAWKDEELVWIEVEEDVDEILVAENDAQIVACEDRRHFLLPVSRSHPCEVHEHHARVESKLTEVRMPRESRIPAEIFTFRLRCQSCELR